MTNIEYTPFLKLKTNEIQAINFLDRTLKTRIAPFIDFPREETRSGPQLEKYMADQIGKIRRGLKGISFFYLDDFDLEDEHSFGGINSYGYLLKQACDLPVVPVIALDRSEERNKAVFELKREKIIKSNIVAIRLQTEDFIDYDLVKAEIEDILGEIISEFDKIDLVFDCRVCSSLLTLGLGKKIANFADNFNSDFPTRHTIVSGSSIPKSVSELAKPDSTEHISRIELDVFDEANRFVRNSNLILGDYTIVSPDYTDLDIPPEIFPKITAPKIFYSYEKMHYVIRGRSLELGGYEQYFDLAHELTTQNFFRGSGYSFGDNYLHEKSQRTPPNSAPGVILKPTINAHISYMLKDYI